MKISRFIISVLFCLLWVVQAQAESSKIDTVYFYNGDRMTGEVKEMDANVLKFSTVGAKTINILWNNLNKVFIKNPMRVTLSDGTIWYGRIYPGEQDEYCYVGEQKIPERHIKITRIVTLLPLKDGFLDRIKGTVSAGIDYSKASNILKFDFNGNIQYWSEQNSWEATYNVALTEQKEVQSTQRQNGGLNFSRILPNNWFVLGHVSAESNSQLQLDLRTSVGGGGGKNLIYTNRKRLYFSGGFVVNREFTKDLVQNNFEGIFSGRYMMYVLNSPEISLNLQGDLIPSISVAGRVRSEVNANLRWEIFSDFYLKWTFYNSTDNKPLSGSAEKNDWSFSLGVEYQL